MKSRLIVFAFILFAVFGGIFYLTLFAPPSDSLQEEEKLSVAVSIPPLKDLVLRIGGDIAEVSVLVPAGASPHTYEPSPGQLRDIASTDVLVLVGTPVEFEILWTDRLLSLNPHLKVIDLSSNIQTLNNNEPHIDAEHGGIDPHIWLSPSNIRVMASTLADQLSALEPEQADQFRQNQKDLDAELIEIDAKIRKLLASLQSRKILVYHDAWEYFARDYGLTTIVAEESGKEPTARSIAKLVDTARQEDIHLIFASPEFASQNVYALAQEIDGAVVLVSPLPENLISSFIDIASSFALIDSHEN